MERMGRGYYRMNNAKGCKAARLEREGGIQRSRHMPRSTVCRQTTAVSSKRARSF